VCAEADMSLKIILIFPLFFCLIAFAMGKTVKQVQHTMTEKTKALDKEMKDDEMRELNQM
jgi:hypothetical protein